MYTPKYLIISLIGLSLCGCQKLVSVPAPINSLVKSTTFSTDQTATSAVSGVYTQMLFNNLYYWQSLETALSADDMDDARTPSDPFQYNALLSNNFTLDGTFWTEDYNTLYTINDAIEGLQSSTSLTDTLKMELTGEMYFSRAFLYFYLTNMFGAVPLVTSSDYTTNSGVGRTAGAKIYSQMIADLKLAQADLPVAYVSTNRGRPNQLAATALLARIYLYTGDYADAEAAASAVINSGQYSLVQDPNSVFLIGSNETIWELDPTGVFTVFNTYQGYQWIPSRATSFPTFVIDSHLLAAFEPGDLRQTDWLAYNTISGTRYYYPFKYKVRTSSTISEGNVCLRLAEQFLIRAEAEANLNDFADAKSDIDVIRSRANLAPTTAATKADLLLAVQHERQVELFTEWGDRWFDLKRTGNANTIFQMEKPGWVATDTLYPIPFAEIQLNPALTQNPGYN